MKKFSAFFKTALVVSVAGTMIPGCSPHTVTPAEAKTAALDRIEKVKDVFHYDPKLLPPLTGNTTSEGSVYEVKDLKQKIWIVVHVSKYGLAEISALPLDNAGNQIPPKD